jgi:uncharacterized integral membrane protein
VSSPEVQFATADDHPTNDGGSALAGVDPSGVAGKGRGRRGGRARARANTDGARHTRISGAWVSVAVAVVLGAALIDFIVQNTRSVRIEFFGANGQIPVAVALLGAALAGAFLVLAVGVARTTQLRLANRRGKKLQKQTEAQVDGSGS